MGEAGVNKSPRKIKLWCPCKSYAKQKCPEFGIDEEGETIHD